MDAGAWCTIESDPGVFSTMLQDFGVKGLQVEELWGLDKSAVEALKSPLKAIIFLFKYDAKIVQKTHENSKKSEDTSIYFSKQMIHNACATQAIINATMNFGNQDSHFELGDILDSIKSFTADFPAETKGETLSNSDAIRSIHNSFARQTVFEVDQSVLRTKKEDPFHFVTYLPINGRLVELDGLMEHPVDHGEIPNPEDWFPTAESVLQKRMQLYGDEIRFNLMAIISNKKQIAENKLAIETEKENMDATLVCQLQNEIEAEDMKFEKYAKENVLRRHNFLPMIIEHLKILAENGELVERVEANRIKLPTGLSA